MITAAGCLARRKQLIETLAPTGPVLLSNPVLLRYLANFYVDPISSGAEYGGLLLLTPDHRATLFHDSRLPKSVEASHVDERKALPWYSGQTPGVGPRSSFLKSVVDGAGTEGRIHDSLADPLATRIFEIVHDMRRRKQPDEIEQLKLCMRATEIGHSWARAHVKAGMSELDVYASMGQAIYEFLGKWAIVYGDFTVSPGSAKRGGSPTSHKLVDGETLILDYSVVLQGYRSDFTNTLVVGGKPNAGQKNLFDLCSNAMAAGEKQLRNGVPCQQVYDAVRGVFTAAGVAEQFPHHAGHGLGLAHPEAPFLVRQSTESLVAGDVVTLEPGLYVDDVGGVRIENNYLITSSGFEQLSHHSISLA